jgi:hypothetical protein
LCAALGAPGTDLAHLDACLAQRLRDSVRTDGLTFPPGCIPGTVFHALLQVVQLSNRSYNFATGWVVFQQVVQFSPQVVQFTNRLSSFPTGCPVFQQVVQFTNRFSSFQHVVLFPNRLCSLPTVCAHMCSFTTGCAVLQQVVQLVQFCSRYSSFATDF